MAKSSPAQQNFVPGTSRGARSRLTLLLAMAQDAEKLAGQAERIRQLRALARVSQLKAANAIGVTPRAYQEWEAGRGDINDDNLKALAQYFGTTPDYIEYGTLRRERRGSPKLFEAKDDDVAAQLATLSQAVNELSAQLEEFRGEAAASASEVMQLLDDRLPPSEESRRRRPA